MTWMCDVVSVVSSRLLRKAARVISVDDIFFIAPSTIGDRIVVKATVNRCFDSNIEVGVVVHAIDVQGAKRKINKAYFTIEPIEPCTPDTEFCTVEPTDDDSRRRFHKALGRRRLRLSRYMHCAWQAASSLC